MGDKNVNIVALAWGLGMDYSWREGGLVASEPPLCGSVLISAGPNTDLSAGLPQDFLYGPNALVSVVHLQTDERHVLTSSQPGGKDSSSPTSYDLSVQHFKVKGLISVVLYYCLIIL